MTGIFKINNNEIIDSAGKLTTAVFPAGTVLQVTHDAKKEGNTINTNYINYHELNITLKSSSSDIYIFFHYGVNTGDINEGHGVRIYRNNSATVTTSHTLVADPYISDSTGPLIGYANSRHMTTHSINVKDTLSGFSAGNTLYYGFFFRKRSNNATVTIPPPDTNDSSFLTTFMEVQK